jgi:transposase InsO family protein
MGFTVWKTPPASRAVRQFLGQLIAKGKATPKYIVCDKGTQFWCGGFKDWCRRKGVRPRFGAVGQHGSIAVVERFIRTMKGRCTRLIPVPLRREAFRGELRAFFDWFNEHWAHSTLRGRTPNEVYQKRFPVLVREVAGREHRIESLQAVPRDAWQ